MDINNKILEKLNEARKIALDELADVVNYGTFKNG